MPSQPSYEITLKGKNGMLCADEGHRVICNRSNLGPWERFTLVKVDGERFAMKGGKDNKWCADEGNQGIKCNRNHVQGWEKFKVEAHGDHISLRGGKDNKYCSYHRNTLVCNKHNVGHWEKLEILTKTPYDFDLPHNSV
jgi:hypothetical protein